MAGGLQEIVYQVDVGRARAWVVRGFFAVLVIGIALYYAIGEFRGLGQTEAMDFAVTARELVRGNGFTTKALKPLGLAQISVREQLRTRTANPDLHVLSFPDLYNPPVYPLVLAGAFKALRTNFKPKLETFRSYRIYMPDLILVAVGQICVLFSALLILHLATNLFDRRVGFLATILFIFTDLVWRFSISGLSTCWVILVLLVSLVSLNQALEADEREESEKVWLWLLLSGLCLGIAFLSRYNVLWILPAYTLFLVLSLRHRIAAVAATVVLSLIIVLPWFVHNYQVSGKFLGGNLALITTTDEDQGGQSLLRSHRTEDMVFSLKNVVRKEFVGWRYYLNNGWELLGGSVAIAFFATSCLHAFKRRRVRLWLGFTLLSFVSLILGTCLFNSKSPAISEHNNIFLLLPLVLTFGTAMFYIVLDRLDIRVQILRYSAIALFGVLNSMSFILTLLPPGSPLFQYPPYHPPVLFILSQAFTPQEVVCSDLGSGFAWYGDRVTVDLPYRMADYLRINDYITYMCAVLLTPASLNQPQLLEIDKGKFKDWAPVLHRQKVPDGFPLKLMNNLPPNDDEYLLITDRARNGF